MELALLVDDGAAVYVNGVELLRQNFPAGPLTNTTNAITNIWQRNLETSYTIYALPTSALVTGANLTTDGVVELEHGSVGAGRTCHKVPLNERSVRSAPVRSASVRST